MSAWHDFPAEFDGFADLAARRNGNRVVCETARSDRAVACYVERNGCLLHQGLVTGKRNAVRWLQSGPVVPEPVLGISEVVA